MTKQQDLKKLKEIPENVSQELTEMKSSISKVQGGVSEIDKIKETISKVQDELSKVSGIKDEISQELSEMKSSISEIKGEIDGQTSKANELYNRLEKVF